MPRSLKKIAHDLMPLAVVSAETAKLLTEALNKLKNYIQFDEQEANECFNHCLEACRNMAVSANLVREYVSEMADEAARE